MAPANMTAALMVDAMDSNSSSSTIAARRSATNPLKNKVVHADIRVQSIEDDNGSDSSAASSSSASQADVGVQLVEQPNPSTRDAEAQQRAEEMQKWWNTEMGKHTDQPDGYKDVAVLLIKWADELDELKTKDEAFELEALFRDRFHYQTKTVELNVRKKPQHQLNSHVSDFIRDHDGPHNLLVVYYTGHGLFHEDKKFLELTACTNPDVCKGFSRDAKANWNKVEEKLRDDEVEGDVLTILDTCYASNLVKKSGRQETKKFELVAASPIDQGTASPGKYSFTRALIDGLAELLNEHKDPVSTFRLVQSINLNKHRSDTPAHVWARDLHTDQHIFLAPLKPRQPQTTPPSTFRPPPGGFLTLRFGLRDAALNKEQIEYMTRTLSHALFNKALLGLRSVEWLDMKAAPPIPHFDRVALVMFAASQWKKVIHKRRRDRASHKRALDDADAVPDAKRRYLDPAQPPSPPVSETSRVGD